MKLADQKKSILQMEPEELTVLFREIGFRRKHFKPKITKKKQVGRQKKIDKQLKSLSMEQLIALQKQILGE